MVNPPTWLWLGPKIVDQSPTEIATVRKTNAQNRLCAYGEIRYRPANARSSGHCINKSLKNNMVNQPTWPWLGPKKCPSKDQQRHQQASWQILLESYVVIVKYSLGPNCLIGYLKLPAQRRWLLIVEYTKLQVRRKQRCQIWVPKIAGSAATAMSYRPKFRVCWVPESEISLVSLVSQKKGFATRFKTLIKCNLIMSLCTKNYAVLRKKNRLWVGLFFFQSSINPI